jgi:5-methylcytosine-specific restriction endonuclease McrA
MSKTPLKKLDANRFKRLRRKYWLNKYKMQKGCIRCGYNASPYALDFDHIEPSSKILSPSRMFLYTLKKLMDEIRKCQLLCRNCHGIRTAHDALKLHGHESFIVGEQYYETE